MASFLLFVLLSTIVQSVSIHAHNITRILAPIPELSSFNYYLSATHLAEDINSRQSITVLAVSDAAMASLIARNPAIYTVKNVLSLHVLTDYFGERKLKQLPNRTTLAASLFQASGGATGTSGFVNITDLAGAKVGFKADGGGAFDSFFVRSVKELPYNISVVQISGLLKSPVAEAPAPAPGSYNLSALMENKGCSAFGRLVASLPDVKNAYETALTEDGLTVFCPVDPAMTKFAPKLKNLTTSDKVALLLYHGLPEYNSMPMLGGKKGVVTTLATDSIKGGYNFTLQSTGGAVTIRTRVTTASLTGTIIDQQPLAIYTVDKVLEPIELFKVPDVGAPAPAPVTPNVVPGPPSAESPAGDEAADGNGNGRTLVGGWSAVVIAIAAVAAGVFWS